jgi:hypothetical protein
MGRTKCARGVLMESRTVYVTCLWTAKQDVFVMCLICTYVRVLCHSSKGLWLKVSVNVTCSAQVLSVYHKWKGGCTRQEE